jgi:hypothetical protein
MNTNKYNYYVYSLQRGKKTQSMFLELFLLKSDERSKLRGIIYIFLKFLTIFEIIY